MVGLAHANAAEVSVFGSLPPPGLYDRLVDPAHYPTFKQRACAVPTWKSFGNRPPLVSGCHHGIDWSIRAEDLERLSAPGVISDTRDRFTGRAYRPDSGILHAPDARFVAGLKHMRETACSGSTSVAKASPWVILPTVIPEEPRDYRRC